jgi:putative transcriptional regulator
MNNRLEWLRKQFNVKQDALAEAMGVSRQTISSIETGKYNPSIILAIKIARYFDLSVEDVFIYEEENQ